jgi:hypothetical protein
MMPVINIKRNMSVEIPVIVLPMPSLSPSNHLCKLITWKKNPLLD